MNRTPIPMLTDVQARILRAMLRSGAQSAGDIHRVTGIDLTAVRKELTPLTGLLITHGETAWDDALTAYERTRQSGEGKT